MSRPSTTVLSGRFQEALVYASQLHATQVRKGPAATPYIGHLLGVASLVLEDGGDEDEAIAALLHDAVEDRPADGKTQEEIRAQFGDRVHRIVLACTDSDPQAANGDPKAEWHARKEQHLRHLAEAPLDVVRVVAADKLHNAWSILGDFRRIGPGVWHRFHAGEAQQLWFYRGLLTSLRQALAGRESRLVEELERVVRKIERIAQEGPGPGNRESGS